MGQKKYTEQLKRQLSTIKKIKARVMPNKQIQEFRPLTKMTNNDIEMLLESNRKSQALRKSIEEVEMKPVKRRKKALDSSISESAE